MAKRAKSGRAPIRLNDLNPGGNAEDVAANAGDVAEVGVPSKTDDDDRDAEGIGEHQSQGSRMRIGMKLQGKLRLPRALVSRGPPLNYASPLGEWVLNPGFMPMYLGAIKQTHDRPMADPQTSAMAIAEARETQSTIPIANYLRKGLDVDNDMRLFLANLLDGSSAVELEERIGREHLTATFLKTLRDCFMADFEKDVESDYHFCYMVCLLFSFGYKEKYPIGINARKRAARFLVQEAMRLTDSQYDAIINPRNRKKRVKTS